MLRCVKCGLDAVFIQRPDGGSGSDDEDFMQPKHKRKAQLGVKVCDVWIHQTGQGPTWNILEYALHTLARTGSSTVVCNMCSNLYFLYI